MPTTTNFGWTTPADTDLVKDGAAAIRTLGSGIDTTLVDLKGGSSGQVLAKNSNTDMDFVWVTQDDSNAIQNAIVDAKGDLIAASGADTPVRLAVGTNEHRLVADSGQTAGLKYVADTTNYAIAAKGDLLVGTAADTLQALTVGTNGQYLIADSTQTTGIKWGSPATGGLVLIEEQDFSAVSSLSFSNNVFTSTYANYRVVMYFSASANAALSWRGRINGTDTTAANYNTQRLEVGSTTVTGARATGQTSARFGQTSSADEENAVSFDIYAPQLTLRTRLNAFGNYGASGSYLEICGTNYNATTSFDSLSILPGSGTITGKAVLYGYAD